MPETFDLLTVSINEHGEMRLTFRAECPVLRAKLLASMAHLIGQALCNHFDVEVGDAITVNNFGRDFRPGLRKPDLKAQFRGASDVR